MNSKFRHLILPLFVGVAGALFVASVEAQGLQPAECEKNGCRLSTGNCDMTDANLQCAEMPAGDCWSWDCAQS